MYISELQPTSVWRQILARIEKTIVEEKKQLQQSLQPTIANVDTATVAMQRAEIIRENLPKAVMRLEQLLMFSIQVKNQTNKENFKIELPDLKNQYEKLEMFTKELLQFIVEQPDRLIPEEDLNNALVEMQVLSNAGSGERINEERIRIRSIERPVYPYGESDAAKTIKPRYYATSMALNQLQATINTLENGHVFPLQFPLEMQNLLNEFEVRCTWRPEDAGDKAEKTEITENSEEVVLDEGTGEEDEAYEADEADESKENSEPPAENASI